MIKIILTFILLATFCTSFAQQKNSIGKSTWIIRIYDDCFDTLRFMKNGSITEYSCEQGYLYKGIFKISDNTLSLITIDDSHSEDGNKIEIYKDYYIIRNNNLLSIGNGRFIAGKWKYTWHKPFKSGYKRIK